MAFLLHRFALNDILIAICIVWYIICHKNYINLSQTFSWFHLYCKNIFTQRTYRNITLKCVFVYKLWPDPVFHHLVSNVSANNRRRRICNAYSYWLRPWPAARDRKRWQSSLGQAGTPEIVTLCEQYPYKLTFRVHYTLIEMTRFYQVTSLSLQTYSHMHMHGLTRGVINRDKIKIFNYRSSNNLSYIHELLSTIMSNTHMVTKAHTLWFKCKVSFCEKKNIRSSPYASFSNLL